MEAPLFLRPQALAVLGCFAALAASYLLFGGNALRGEDLPTARSPLSRLGLSEVPFGTSLDRFKRSYRRTAADGRTAPYCSDDHPKGDYVRSSVPGVELYNCWLHFPEEQLSPDFQPPRILSFDTLPVRDSPVGYGLIFRFLPADGVARLWRVEGVFSLRHWRAAGTALEDRLGLPARERENSTKSYGAAPEVVQRVWTADGASFTLHRYFGDYLTSALVAEDDELEAAFRRRVESARSTGEPAL